MNLKQGTQDVRYIKPATDYNQERTKRAITKYIRPMLEHIPDAKILDVGGGDQPLRHASHIIDLQTYREKPQFGIMGYQGLPIRFNANTWIVHNICDYPWPFKDKEFDFIWCTQTLEDIRDPIGACKEMMRVGKTGYIGCPGKFIELHRPINQYVGADTYNGYWHHRWLVSVVTKQLVFEQKNIFGFMLELTDNITKKILKYHPELGTTELYWEDKFDVVEKFELDSLTAVNSLLDYKAYIIRRHGNG